MQILIVEDEVIPANYLKKVLELEGYKIIGIIRKGAEAISMAKQKKPDVILMDIMLKDHISGAEAATQIHASLPEVMIIFLTAYSDEEMIDFAVESDAFAYLLKPYRDKEILATLELAKAKLFGKNKMEGIEIDSSTIRLVDGYTYDTNSKRLFLDDKEINLGFKALKLIQLLCKNKHITLEIDMILHELWDSSTSGQTLRSLIHRIRTVTTPNLIQNTNKFGYRIGLKE
jgi:DNA-binding response OmpR family regulator